ncbi:MAG: PTS sugar transporter subunit IIA, partial [Enterococcus casseliflavus]
MLRYFYENELVAINHEQPEDWEAAIWASGEGLKQKALITDQYIEDVIRDVHQYGPYIVIIPKVAMPHSSAESKGVLGTGIG